MQEKKLKYRYPGVNYFRKEDRDVFCGRDEDAQKLYTQVMLSNTVVLHGDSGTGKSSLLQAGLLPLLEENDPEYIPVLIRFDEYKKTDKSAPAGNIVVESLVRQTIAKMQSYELELRETRLPYVTDREDDLWYEVKLFEYNKRPILFIFDQFEEIQGYTNKEINYFIRELADLFKSEIPADIYNEIQDHMSQLFDRADISDADRDTFNRAMRFLESPLKVRILFVVREDKLGIMSLLSDQFPDILKNSYLLRQLTPANARKAITDPAGKDGDFVSKKFSFDNIDTLLKNLTEPNTNLVDPLQIQIICSNIERTIAVNKTVIYEKDIPRIDDIINNFYTSCWAEVKKLHNFSSASFDRMRRYYIRELVAGDKRKLVFKDDFLIPEFSTQTEQTIKTLCRTGLLRVVSSDIGAYYQLCHDRLIPPLVNDLVQLNAKKIADARTRKRLNTVRTIGLIGVAIFAFAFFYQKRVSALREGDLRHEAEIRQDQLERLTALARNKELERQRDSATAYLESMKLSIQKDSAEAYARTAELIRRKDSVEARVRYNQLAFTQAIAAGNARRDSTEKLRERLYLESKVAQANHIKDSMLKILIASDMSKLSQQSKTNFEQKVYAWLAYDTLPEQNRDEAFSPGVYGALANSLLDSLVISGPRVPGNPRRAAYVSIEKVFVVNGKQHYSVPFRGVRDDNDRSVFRDSTMIRSWVDKRGMFIASVNIASKERKVFLVRKIASGDTLAIMLLGTHEDINSVVFDMKNNNCVFSTIAYDGKPGRIHYLETDTKKTGEIQLQLETREYVHLAMGDNLSGVTNRGRYFDWDPNYINAVMDRNITLSERLQRLNSVRYLLREKKNVFIGDEFGNIYMTSGSTPTRVLASESGRVTAIAADDNSEWVAASFANGTLALWRLNSARPVPAFLAGGNACAGSKSVGRFVSIAFSADNKSLMAVSEYGKVFRFPLSMARLADKICKNRDYLNDPVARKKNNVPSKIRNICE